ncbi:MAG TPA: hypothetical protein P5099_02980 [Candidatus Moranbacteria bacterium]|nr:hypothetical protein [Candidatus Moranbacteria bacterium]
MNIYLDIDGVLLANEKNPAKHADEFIKYVVKNYPTYWLTTHCNAENDHAAELLSDYFSDETMKYIRKIKSTDWRTWKTEAIDFTQPFLWFDDDLFEKEREELKRHGALDNWIEVDLRKNEDALGRFLSSFPIPN